MQTLRCIPVTWSSSLHLFFPTIKCLQNYVQATYSTLWSLLLHINMSQLNPLTLDSNIHWRNTKHWNVWVVLQGMHSLVRLGLHYNWVGHGSKISLLLSGEKTGVKIPKTHKLNNYSLSTGRKYTIRWEKQRSKHTAISLINVCRTAMCFQKHSYLQTLYHCFTFMAYS
jgi:hypothetical protein